MAKVVDKFVMQLEDQLADRGVEIELSEAAKAWLAKKGHDTAFGARPLARVIQEQVKKPLADELLFGKLSRGGRVTVDVEAGELGFDFPDPEPEKKPPGKKKGGGKKKVGELVR
jgi:ATP-dependent Clp protease ATP-binding subunit ClpA